MHKMHWKEKRNEIKNCIDAGNAHWHSYKNVVISALRTHIAFYFFTVVISLLFSKYVPCIKRTMLLVYTCLLIDMK